MDRNSLEYKQEKERIKQELLRFLRNTCMEKGQYCATCAYRYGLCPAAKTEISLN